MSRRDPLLVRLYGRSLLLLPRPFRDAHGEAMVAMFAQEWHSGGRLARSILCLRAACDLVITAAAERARPAMARPPRPVTANLRIGFSWLDLKLAGRMLVRYPGLTIVGGLAMAFAICVGAATFELLTQVVHPTLPLPDGHRLVSFQLRNAVSGGREAPSFHDFEIWRESLRSVEEVGASRTAERNLVIPGGTGQPVRVAEVTASALRATRVPPLLGRALADADEEPGAPAVALIGEEIWQTRLEGTPDVLGRTVRLGGVERTVVGVMPRSFGFPMFQSIWIPMRVDALEYPPGTAPAVRVVGRLAPGAEIEQARVEIAAKGSSVGLGTDAAGPPLKPEIVPYTQTYLDLSEFEAGVVMASNLLLILLLVLVCGNVALLIFARAATREREIVIRNALGASRGRIVGQLFIEALVLGSLAAIMGLAAAGRALSWAMKMIQQEMTNGNPYPFWITGEVSGITVAYAAALTLIAAMIAGVIPGIQVTGARAASSLQAQSARTSGPRMGGIWTAVIVTQVALTMLFPATAYLLTRDAAEDEAADFLRADAYVVSRLEMDSPVWIEDGPLQNAAPERFDARVRALEERLEADPEVVGVTYADRLPGMYHPWIRIEVDQGALLPREVEIGHRVGEASVAPNYFETFDATIIAGRGFDEADSESGSPVVVVSESLVERVLGGRNAVGRRIRYLNHDFWNGDTPEPLEERTWYEVVGVVSDLPSSGGSSGRAVLYHPAAPGQAYPLQLALETRSDATAFIPRLRALVADVDPGIRLYDPKTLQLADFGGEEQFLRFWFRTVVTVAIIATMLALTGIYAVLSFTVARRTREIGVRVALGARASQVLTGVLRRPLRQVGAGLALGAGATALLMVSYWGAPGVTMMGVILFMGYALLMTGICALACVVPSRRALRIEPTEALTSE